jgi:hypothetical protein
MNLLGEETQIEEVEKRYPRWAKWIVAFSLIGLFFGLLLDLLVVAADLYVGVFG